jgi:hypothetical protein
LAGLTGLVVRERFFVAHAARYGEHDGDDGDYARQAAT